jgi:hypothetical protein
MHACSMTGATNDLLQLSDTCISKNRPESPPCSHLASCSDRLGNIHADCGAQAALAHHAELHAAALLACRLEAITLMDADNLDAQLQLNDMPMFLSMPDAMMPQVSYSSIHQSDEGAWLAWLL